MSLSLQIMELRVIQYTDFSFMSHIANYADFVGGVTSPKSCSCGSNLARYSISAIFQLQLKIHIRLTCQFLEMSAYDSETIRILLSS